MTDHRSDPLARARRWWLVCTMVVPFVAAMVAGGSVLAPELSPFLLPAGAMYVVVYLHACGWYVVRSVRDTRRRN